MSLAYVKMRALTFFEASMASNQGKGLKAWQAALTPEERKRFASAGGRARAKALGPKRRKEIASRAAKARVAGIYARKQSLIE